MGNKRLQIYQMSSWLPLILKYIFKIKSIQIYTMALQEQPAKTL